MTTEANLPVLVGVGQILQRTDDPAAAAEPLEMMIQALDAAAADAGAPALLAQADSVRVIRGMWKYGDPARVVAERVGCAGAETMGSPFGGNFAQATLNDACRQIAAGQCKVALIAGAENGRSHVMAKRAGIKLDLTKAPGEPDRMIAEEKHMWHPAELARGIQQATEHFSLVESAIRHARGETVDAHRRRIAGLWAGFNEVARDNPHAWIRKAYTADEIGTVSDANPLVCTPYPRLMNANMRVDMGAALIVCSVEAARAAGVAEDKFVFLHAGTEVNDADSPSTRDNMHSAPAMGIGGKAALELAGVTADDVAHLDLYSCFPAAVQLAATAIGIDLGRQLTVTGGLTFGGGPLNCYSLTAIARMVEVLRADPGSRGFVGSVGGFLAKYSFGVYSTERPKDGFAYANPQHEADGLPRREALVDFEGPVTIEAHTVAHAGGEPRYGLAACLTEDGKRTWARVEDDRDLLDAMAGEDLVGRAARLDGNGGLQLS